MQDSLLLCGCIRAGARTGGVSNGTLNFSVDVILWACGHLNSTALSPYP